MSDEPTPEQVPEAGETAGKSAGGKNPLSGDVSGAREVAIRQREAEMVQLRAAHTPLRVIAERFGISEGRVSRIVSRALRQSVQRPSDEYRAEQILQIDEHLRALARPALGLPRFEGEERPTLAEQARVTEVCARLLAQRSKITGLDTYVLQHEGMSQEERASALADSMRAYMQGREDVASELAAEGEAPTS